MNALLSSKRVSMLGSIALPLRDYLPEENVETQELSIDDISVPFKAMAAKGEDRQGVVIVRHSVPSV